MQQLAAITVTDRLLHCGAIICLPKRLDEHVRGSAVHERTWCNQTSHQGNFSLVPWLKTHFNGFDNS